ncbi:putative type I restriction enzymeP M protein [Flavobacterium anhuiense]|uniref:site-specific DNA-methyltransferase (adenine-specific) n=1 Tax=Flavobacterium anhuiense TaxID=459526 RepID=A0AAC9D5Y6_9FLAO|nr:N-6 DNA methylase [Flavobacterium anhuiense]AOC97164.1 putative type I restriction enzymeP M protein [Flavobacterium anhuiense]
MLDNITKRRIDDCRDILVGKLPDPKSQIEQITIALIYKFMDDMDKEAIELGGKAKFFSDYKIPDPNDSKKEIIVSFEKYSWDNLFDTKVSATEMLKLYSEAIEGMVKNPNIPELFANIFKNAYLPYRDPETLKMFLKTISEFEYTHSEKLGDAFEYLLSVMGSQGDAGQFRTPRHIIDFLVEVVDPKKDETILDPACGTAGFLISAFKHIKENNNNLTPDERKKLIKNFIGYDISPDMVRLSLVNLYLHGFSDPHVFEYDTLSSEDRWDETFDIVLANPPFMSPKGGIRPHKKFTISSNRSEVLFVDYIAEHLTPKGRAGIIVPEGIIFQSGTAYKALRKMLVDKYLYAVVSLPAGVFNPYSGVKTSILLMDANLSKKTEDILFIKIDNDGYSLGAQRNPVKGGQLQEAVSTLKTFRQNCIDGKEFNNTTLAQRVTKNEIGKSGDYNLSGERYKNTEVRLSSYPIVELGSLINVDNGRVLTEFEDNGSIACIKVSDMNLPENTTDLITSSHWIKETSFSLLPVNSIVFPKRGAAIATNKKRFTKIPCLIDNNCMGISVNNEKILNPRYLFAFMRQFDLTTISNSAGIALINNPDIKGVKIPLPPLSIQEEIVAEIESYQKIIDGAKIVVDNYKPRIELDNSWEKLAFEDICVVNPKKSEINNLDEKTEVSFVPMADLNENQMDFVVNQVKPLNEVYKGYTYFKEDDVLLAKVTPCFENGKAGIAKNLINGIGFGSSEYYVFRPNKKILSIWIYLNIITDNFREKGKLNMTGTGGLQRIPTDFVKSYKIPVPSIKIQQEIVSQIEKEQALINANKELISIYEQKIKDRINKVWTT